MYGRMGGWVLSRRWLAFACTLLGFGVSDASGGMLDFNIDGLQPAGAKISYAGGGSALLGTKIGVDSVSGIDTPILPFLPIEIFSESSVGAVAALAPTQGVLTFTTGSYVGNNGGLGWEFSGGGSFEIRGIIDFNGDDVIDAVDQAALASGGGVLLSGTFADSVRINLLPVGFAVLSAGLENVFVNSSVAALFGLPATGPSLEGGLNLSFMIPATKHAGDSFISTRVFSGDVATVPELGSLSMLALASLVAVHPTWRRRKVA